MQFGGPPSSTGNPGSVYTHCETALSIYFAATGYGSAKIPREGSTPQQNKIATIQKAEEMTNGTCQPYDPRRYPSKAGEMALPRFPKVFMIAAIEPA
jgi:hypothetical protein